MPDHSDTAHAQQRRAAGLGIIGALAEIVERALGKRVPDLGRQAALDRFLQHTADVLHKTFAELQCDIADKSVAHDHVHVAAEYVAPFHVAHEIQRQIAANQWLLASSTTEGANGGNIRSSEAAIQTLRGVLAWYPLLAFSARITEARRAHAAASVAARGV